MGVEVGTGRTWHRGEDGARRPRRRREHARPRARRLLPRARGVRSQLSANCVAVHIPIGAEHELTGIVDVLHMCAYMSPEGAREGGRTAIPAEAADLAAEYREKLLDAVVETDEALMERYLDGQELSDEEVAKALKDAVTRGEVFPVAAAVATKNLGTTALLDLLVEGVPSPARRKAHRSRSRARATAAFVFKTIADPFAGPDQRLPRPQGDDHHRHDADGHARAREGADRDADDDAGQGPRRGRRVRRGRHRRGREAEGRDDRRPAARQGGRGRASRASTSPSR